MLKQVKDRMRRNATRTQKENVCDVIGIRTMSHAKPGGTCHYERSLPDSFGVHARVPTGRSRPLQRVSVSLIVAVIVAAGAAAAANA